MPNSARSDKKIMKSPHKTALESKEQHAGIRWTVNAAASEFSHDRRTIRRRLSAAGEQAGPDGKFSTQQICRAVFNNLELERTRLTRAQADIAEVQCDELLRNWLPRDGVIKVWNATLEILRGVISSRSDIPEHLKADLLRDLQPPDEREYLADAPFTEQEGPLSSPEE